MCKPHNPRVIDKCLRKLILNLIEYMGDDYDIIACCCGHGRYPMTLVVREYFTKDIIDWCSNIKIPRKKRFYLKDKDGYYYIPEVCKCYS